MAINLEHADYLKASNPVTVAANSTEAVLATFDVTKDDSKNLRVVTRASNIVDKTGISIKLQHSWDSGTSWEDVGSAATSSFVSNSVADGAFNTATDEVTATGHGFATGDRVFYTTQGGTPATGLTDDTSYYAIKVDANTFKVAASRANAIAGTAIDITAPAGGSTHYFSKTTSNLVLNIEDTADQGSLPLWDKVRVVAVTGTGDVLTVDGLFVSRRTL